MAQCPQLVVRTKTSKIRYHAGHRGKQVRRGFSGKFLVNINCRTYAWVAQRKSNVLITRRSGFRYSPQAPPERELWRLTSSKGAFVIRRTCQAIIDESPFCMGVQSSWQNDRLLIYAAGVQVPPFPPVPLQGFWVKETWFFLIVSDRNMKRIPYWYRWWKPISKQGRCECLG